LKHPNYNKTLEALKTITSRVFLNPLLCVWVEEGTHTEQRIASAIDPFSPKRQRLQ